MRLMVCRRVFILNSAVSFIHIEASKYLSKETGGPLVGYMSDDNVVVVTNANGPGENAIRRLFSVTISGAGAQKFCDKIRRQSGGFLDYVGDWHSHIGCSVRYSSTDVEAMRTMAAFEHSPTKNPISLIYSKVTKKIAAYVFYEDEGLVAVPSSIVESVSDLSL